MHTGDDDGQKRKYRSLIPPEERSRKARYAALIRHSQCDGSEATQAARDAFKYEKFAHEVDPLKQLDPRERMRRAQKARRAYMRRLAEKSARTRRARAATAQQRIYDLTADNRELD